MRREGTASLRASEQHAGVLIALLITPFQAKAPLAIGGRRGHGLLQPAAGRLLSAIIEAGGLPVFRIDLLPRVRDRRVAITCLSGPLGVSGLL